MRLTEYLKCALKRGHRYKPSHKKPGYETCTYCRHRRLLTRGRSAT